MDSWHKRSVFVGVAVIKSQNMFVGRSAAQEFETLVPHDKVSSCYAPANLVVWKCENAKR